MILIWRCFILDNLGKAKEGLRLVLGRAGSGKTTAMYAELAARCREGKKSILLIPEQLSHEAEVQLQSYVPEGNASLNAEVLSFTRLSTRVRAMNPIPGVPSSSLDNAGKLLCMAVAAENIRSQLRVYKTSSLNPDILSLLLDAITELKSSCITSQQMGDYVLHNPGGLGDKMRDLSLLMEAYDAVVTAGGADSTDPVVRCAELIGGTSFPEADFYIDGFTDFTIPQLEVIKALMLRGTNITVCLTCDGLEESIEIFEASRKAAAALLRMAEENSVSSEITEFTRSCDGPMDTLEKHLFSFSPVNAESDDRIMLCTAPTVSAECEMAAAKCIELVRSGCRYRDIAIAVRGFDSYRPMLESMFARYEVPLYCTRKVPLCDTPVPAFTKAAYDVISGGWSTEDVMTYIKTGLCGLTPDECDDLDIYSFKWSIRGSSWYGESPFTLPPDGFTGKDADKNAETLLRLNALRERVCAPLRLLSRLSEKAETALQQAQALAEFYEAVNLPSTLESIASDLEENGRTQDAATMSALWEKTVSCLEQYAAVLGNAPQDARSFSSLFNRMLGTVETATIPLTLDKVTAGDMDRMRRRTIKHLIVLGCDSGRIPSLGSVAGIFSDDERELLSSSGLELGGTVSHRLAREYALLYSAFTLPSDTLTLSYCTGGSDGNVQSAFLYRRCADIFGISPESVSLPKCRLQAGIPAFDEAAAALGGSRTKEALAALKGCEAQKERLERVKKAASSTRGRLSPSYIKALYGKRLSLSASRAEKFASCKYSYFLRYTMKAEPRQKAEFNAPELGTFLHWLLENIVRDTLNEGGFENAGDDRIREKCAEYTARFVAEKLNDFQSRTERFIHLFNRLTEDAEEIVLDTIHELSKSSFTPLDFELSFGRDLSPVAVGGMQPNGKNSEVSITGVADRVDGWVRGDDLFVRIVDYKSGHKKFSFSDVYNGLGLQMLMYLFAITSEGGERYGKNIVPAGVLYVPARNNVIPFKYRPTEDEALTKRKSSVRRSGLILDDPDIWEAMEADDRPEYIPLKFTKEGASGDSLATAERIGLLSKHVKKCLENMALEMREGSIFADPWFRTPENRACTYCEYLSVCSAREGSTTPRRLGGMKADEFWEKLEEKYGN